MADGIIFKVLGDHGPFSSIGKSIGYQITIGQSNFLIDCGAPLFQQIGGHGLKNIDGLIITHCHDDHKRWYSDIALFNMYAADVSRKVSLLTSETLNEEIMKASAPALDRSLSADSRSVIDIPYEDFVDFTMLGPESRYKISSVSEGNGRIRYCIHDRNGSMVDPDRAKIVVNPKTKRVRMLFKDPDYNEWIEPESFYTFSATAFYETEQNIYRDKEGFSVQAIKAAVWHGVPAIGIKITTDTETLIFSSDTVHDPKLWSQLYTEKRIRKMKMSNKEFESASVIYGDINEYIERQWSEERYIEAINTFHNAVVVHDVSGRKSIVHTDYEKLKSSFLRKDKTLLTHSPDLMTSEWVLCNTGKTYKISGDKFYEMVDGRLFLIDADVYHRDRGRYFVGYRNTKGKYRICEEDGLLSIALDGDSNKGRTLYRVDLYEDISGKYFPTPLAENSILYERKDGKVERIEFNEYGSTGEIVTDCRDDLLKRQKAAKPKLKKQRCPA
jgi:ribonuclease BN (tRNA processing enzyme)